MMESKHQMMQHTLGQVDVDTTEERAQLNRIASHFSQSVSMGFTRNQRTLEQRIENEEIDLDKLTGTSDMKKVKDLKGRPLLLFVNEWSIRMTIDRNDGLKLTEFGRS